MSMPLSFRSYSLILALCLLVFFSFRNPALTGDIDEYSLSTVALGSHLSAAITLTDIQKAQTYSPVFAPIFQVTADGMRNNAQVPKPGFYRARNGEVFAIHFAGYSALAVLPFLVFEKIGISPFMCFFFVNLVFVFVLGLCLFRFFESAWKASAGLVLFLLVGGLNYIDWSGPETMSATALCAGLLLLFQQSYRLAGLLLGLAAMQNPPIVFAVFFAPAMLALVRYQSALSLSHNIRNFFTRNMVIGLAIACLGFLLPVSFNYWAFGVPNIIVKVATSTEFISASRLFSYYFDLSQGMIIAMPALWVGILALCFYPKSSTSGIVRKLLLAALATLFSVALALPALAAGNWNSGALGMMRYVVWGGIPFLFVFLFLLRDSMECLRQRGKVSLIFFVGVIFFVQALLTYSAHTYVYFEFSPIAKTVLKYAPTWYNPEYEIFIERNAHKDGADIDVNQVYIYGDAQAPKKILFHGSNPKINTQMCGIGRELTRDNQFTQAEHGWRYLHGNARCTQARSVPADVPLDSNRVVFGAGWSVLEKNGGTWNGRWSDGGNSTISISLEAKATVAEILLIGHYFEDNRRTRVFVDGTDRGWHTLDGTSTIVVHDPKPVIKIELQHEFPTVAPFTPEFPDGRKLALFLRTIILNSH